MSKRVWRRCNARKARALIIQGETVRFDHKSGTWQCREPKTKSKGYQRRLKSKLAEQAKR